MKANRSKVRLLNFYKKFLFQQCEISDTLNDRSDDNCKLDNCDVQPEMYQEMDRDHVQFGEVKGQEKETEKL